MSIRTRYKRWLCKGLGTYRDGKIYVPAGLVAFNTSFITFTALMLMWLSYKLILDIMSSPYEKGTEVIKAALMFTGVIIAFGVVLWFWIFIFPRIWLLKLLGKKLEVVCERITFPESVKRIYTEIESLPAEEKKILAAGLRPLMRKYQLDEKL